MITTEGPNTGGQAKNLLTTNCLCACPFQFVAFLNLVKSSDMITESPKKIGPQSVMGMRNPTYGANTQEEPGALQQGLTITPFLPMLVVLAEIMSFSQIISAHFCPRATESSQGSK